MAFSRNTKEDVNTLVEEIRALWAELGRLVAEKDMAVARCINNDLRLMALADEKDELRDALEAFQLASKSKGVPGVRPSPAPIPSLLRTTRSLKRKLADSELPSTASSKPAKLGKTAKTSGIQGARPLTRSLSRKRGLVAGA
ncbi:hypothetical protein DFH09DRAFT_1089348 [Mycena vulgaris]|nr:hypothetical protein DFH09DRAFT_1089348 [Mycena vulgaris]